MFFCSYPAPDLPAAVQGCKGLCYGPYLPARGAVGVPRPGPVGAHFFCVYVLRRSAPADTCSPDILTRGRPGYLGTDPNPSVTHGKPS